MNPNQEPTQEQKEAFMRLENEVAAMKKRSHPPEITTYDETRNMRNVVCASEGIADILPILQEKERKWNDFVRQVDWELEKMEPEFCLEHEDVRLVVDRDKTLSGTWFHPEKRITVRYQGCPVCVEALTKSLVNERWVKMGIPHKVLHATMDNFKTDTDKKQRLFLKVETFLKRGGGFLIFRGEVGTGKSHLGTAIIKDAGEGIFVTELDLLAEFRGTYGGKGDENAVIEKYRTCKVLVLDELSAEVKGVDIAGLLYRVLADRYDKGLLTVITSNEKLDVILDILGARLADRVKHSYYVATFDWESARKSENS